MIKGSRTKDQIATLDVTFKGKDAKNLKSNIFGLAEKFICERLENRRKTTRNILVSLIQESNT